MSRLQEGERSKVKVQKRLVADDTRAIGVVRDEEAGYGQFKRPPFEGLSRTAIPIDQVPQPQYEDVPSVTQPSDHAPELATSAPTEKARNPKSLQEGEVRVRARGQEGNRVYPFQKQESEESEASEPEGSDDTDIDDLEPSPEDKPKRKRRLHLG